MYYEKIRIILEKIAKIVCVNSIPWLCCAVFMLPALPVSSIFINIMENYLGLERQLSSFVGMILFMIISVLPIFLIPQPEYKKKRK